MLPFLILAVGLALIPPLEARFGPAGPRRSRRANLAFVPIVMVAAGVLGVLETTSIEITDEQGRGLIPFLGLEGAAALIVTILGLDLAGYLSHRLRHRVGALWAFHRTHHTDTDMDITTTLRQHPGDLVGLIAVSAAALLVLGSSAAHFAISGILATVFGLWDHLRIQLPPQLERRLGLVFQTPGLHRVHHSPHQVRTDSNFGLIFTFWDRLGGTFQPAGEREEVGLDTIDLEDRQTLRAMLLEPARPLVKVAPPASAEPARELVLARR
jgi:sterol desaturase/sphingolipid hydroxylase (fatty acid hydroxylase superfamily)